jgi:hypothetical protein|tara:strand:- start:709 stop:1092 length:384 start_codon:yes stop_codon:yes gene_type:complete
MGFPFDEKKEAKIITLNTDALDAALDCMETEIAQALRGLRALRAEHYELAGRVSRMDAVLSQVEAKVEEYEGARDEAEHGGEPVEYVTHDDVECIIEDSVTEFLTEEDVMELLNGMKANIEITLSAK